MAMRILIVDDEDPARERLKRYLADLKGVKVIGEAPDGVQAVEMIETRIRMNMPNAQKQEELDLLKPGRSGLQGRSGGGRSLH